MVPSDDDWAPACELIPDEPEECDGILGSPGGDFDEDEL
jgi:hypothetical protein